MKIKRGQPWFTFLVRWFVAEPPEGAVFTYGKTIWTNKPTPLGLDAPLLAHERAHARQQGWFPFIWWARWLTSRSFRLDQESRAYSVQWRTIRNRESRRYHITALYGLASLLAGEMYGGLCDEKQARALILDRSEMGSREAKW